MHRLLVIDNYDSFTWNLVHYLEGAGELVVDVVRNDEVALELPATYDGIVLSPGPGLPEESGMLMQVIARYVEHKPILGVCLGHQAIAQHFGGTLKQLTQVLHGVQRTCLLQQSSPLTAGLPTTFQAGRYHSWVVNQKDFPSVLEVLVTDEEGEVMAYRHRQLPVYGVQFHPESIMTPEGKRMIGNWVALLDV